MNAILWPYERSTTTVEEGNSNTELHITLITQCAPKSPITDPRKQASKQANLSKPIPKQNRVALP